MAAEKRIILDSSTAILLFKCGLVEKFCSSYNIIIPCSVYDELTVTGREGAQHFRELCEKRLMERYNNEFLDNPEEKSIARLGRGERDVLLLYIKGEGDFVAVDDGEAVQWCRKNSIPHVNAILLTRILFESEIIDRKFFEKSFNACAEAGRYSQWIIDFARSCKAEEIGKFFPGRFDVTTSF